MQPTTITYNGQTILSDGAYGQHKTLVCGNKMMADDVVVNIGGVDVSQVTATAADVISGKSFIQSDGDLAEGTLINSDMVAVIDVQSLPNLSITISKSGQPSQTRTADGTGHAYFTVYSSGVWTVSGGGASQNITVQQNVTLQMGFLRVGGRIFYIQPNNNGATYRFFKQDGTELTTISVAGLANAYWYSVSGTPTFKKFYVYDNVQGLQSNKYWGYCNTTTGVTTNSIGSGLSNTNTILNRGVPTDYSPNIWGYIRDCRDNKLNGNNDWFIASEAEQDQLRISGLVNWYSSNYIWSSVEYDSRSAYDWGYNGSGWYNGYKNYRSCCFAARAF